MRTIVSMLAATAVVMTVCSADAAEKRQTPYFASIAPSKARMRSGPGRTYPAIWLYVRPDLPVKVIDTFKEWRKVEDPGGTQGWILGTLVSDTRTAIVKDDVAEMRDQPGGSRVVWRAEPGVVGRVSQCRSGWCRFDVRGQAGFIEVGDIWGVEATESLP